MKKLLVILFLISGMNLTAQRADNTPKAIIIPLHINQMRVSEKRLSEHYNTPVPQDSSWFEYRTGSKKVLIVAGHAAAHMREEKRQYADEGTGSLGIKLNHLADVSVFFTKYLSPSDPNYYDNNAFKDSLAIIIDQMKPIIVIDLHCAHPYRPFDIDFGTMNGKSYLMRDDLLKDLKAALKNEGIINFSQDYFAAVKNKTITKFVSNKGVPCIQLEINANYLSPDLGFVEGQKTAQLLQALIRFIEHVE